MNICSSWSGSALSVTAGPGSSCTRRRCSSSATRSSSGPECNGLEVRRRQLRQQAIGLHEAVQRVGAALHHAQAAAEIAHACRLRRPCASDARQQAAGDGLDGRERIGKLVAQNADQPLPCSLLFFLQRQAHVGKQQQRVRARRPGGTSPCAAASARAWRRTNEWTGRRDASSISRPSSRAVWPKQRA